MVKMVLIGAGRMGHRFSQAIRQSGHDLNMIFDPSEMPWAVQQEADLAKIHTRNFNDVITSSAEVYVICTTADHHVRIATELIISGVKRLIIEKPLCQSVAEGIALEKLAKKNSVRIIVNHGRRYSKNTATLKDLDGDPRTGSLRSIIIKMGGGSFGCVGTHWIDLCNNLMEGLPNKIFGILSNHTPVDNRGNQYFDPGGTAVLTYDKGKRAIIDLGDDIGIVVGAEFVYEKGVVSWSVEGGKWTFMHRSLSDSEKPLTHYGIPLIETNFESSAPDLIEYAVAAINDALSDAEINSGVSQALDTMEVFAGIRYSARDGKIVSLPIPEIEKQISYDIP